jgi:hypothetical protein
VGTIICLRSSRRAPFVERSGSERGPGCRVPSASDPACVFRRVPARFHDKLPPPLRAFPSSSLPPECCESKTEIHLGHGPSARRLFVGHFFLAIGRDRLLDLLRPILSQAERREIGTAPARGYIPSGPRDRLRPPLAASPCRSRVRRAARAQGRDLMRQAQSCGQCLRKFTFRASRYAATASSSCAIPPSCLESVARARPRFIWVAAHSFGQSLWVHSFRASRWAAIASSIRAGSFS